MLSSPTDYNSTMKTQAFPRSCTALDNALSSGGAEMCDLKSPASEELWVWYNTSAKVVKHTLLEP